MAEVSFVLKSLLVTALLMVFMQVKVGNSTIEQNTQQWLQTSSVSLYIQKVASGAVLFVRNSSNAISNTISKTFSGGTARESRASKLNIEFKRNPKIEERQQSRTAAED